MERGSAPVSALLVIDAQMGLLDRPTAVPSAAETTARIAEMLAAARSAGALVIHLQNDGEPGARDEPGSRGWAIHPAAEPSRDEPVLRKRGDDGFEGTSLETLLREAGVRRLAVAGLLSETCVSATIRGAFARGFQVVLVRGAHATYDVEDIAAEVVSRVAEHALGDQLELVESSAVAFVPPQRQSSLDAEWKWDKTLFGGSARYYRAGRFPYPDELATAFQEELGLDGSGRLLDVGSGTGEIALLLAPLYDEVVGLDADEDMIAEAREEALRRGHRNTTWVNARAEELPLDLGNFRTATFAQSFHWMDRERVAATVFEMLEPNGAWVHVDTKTHRGAASDEQLSHPQPPRGELEELVERYVGPVKRAGQGSLPGGTPSGEGEIMVAAGFAGPRRRVLDSGRVYERSEDEIVASIFSVTSSAPHLFGSRLEAFEQDVRQVLRRVSPGGRFCEVSQPLQLIIWTRPLD